jgi:hypothetical protein
MFNRLSRAVVTAGVIGASSMLLILFCSEAYKYFTLTAADYAQSEVSDILTRGIFIFFLVTLSGIFGIAAEWLDRLSR